MTRIQFEEGSKQPRYDSYCLSNVTSTLLSTLGVESGRTKLPRDVLDGVDTTGIENVVLFVFDGLGYNEWGRQRGEGFFGRMNGGGRTTPITTVFPSTTSTALTTLATGLLPQEHTLIEWYLYLKEADTVIQTLPFSPVGAGRSDLLLPKVRPRVLFKGEPIFARLKREGIGAHSYLGRYIAHSAYSGLVHRASRVEPYSSSSDLAVMLRKGLESASGPSFHYVYWSSIDTLEHLYGPDSEEAYVEASTVSHALRTGLLDRLDNGAARKTLFVVTADHGHVFSPMEKIPWLNSYKKLVWSLAKGRSGKPIPPWGAPRDVYVRVEEEKLDEVHDHLSSALAGVATVVRSADAVAAGLFGGGPPSKRLLERVGNLMILPKGKGSIWYRYPGVERLRLTGQHGGMHPDEMTIPLTIARASSLLG